MSCGGFKAAEKANADIQGIIDSVKAEVETKTGSSCAVYEALSFRSQVVAGVNFIIKTKINNDGGCIHIKIHKPLPHTRLPPSLMDVATGHNVDSEVAPW